MTLLIIIWSCGKLLNKCGKNDLVKVYPLHFHKYSRLEKKRFVSFLFDTMNLFRAWRRLWLFRACYLLSIYLVRKPFNYGQLTLARLGVFDWCCRNCIVRRSVLAGLHYQRYQFIHTFHTILQSAIFVGTVFV